MPDITGTPGLATQQQAAAMHALHQAAMNAQATAPKTIDIGAHKRVVEAVRQMRQEQAGATSGSQSPAGDQKLDEKQLQRKLRESAKSQGKGAAKVSVVAGNRLSDIEEALKGPDPQEALYDLMKKNRWTSITLIDGEQVSTIYRQDIRHQPPRYLSSAIDDTAEPDTTLKPFDAGACEALLTRLFQVGQTQALIANAPDDSGSIAGDGNIEPADHLPGDPQGPPTPIDPLAQQNNPPQTPPSGGHQSR